MFIALRKNILKGLAKYHTLFNGLEDQFPGLFIYLFLLCNTILKLKSSQPEI